MKLKCVTLVGGYFSQPRVLGLSGLWMDRGVVLNTGESIDGLNLLMRVVITD